MSLDEYKRKRRFEATPEPPPEVAKKSGNRFVVQKHRASHLHYDFRLEMDGVLKSWAVPKGPSLDPADKRLAMQVEDHPVSYFDFEGTIPEGNYGAGSVMVWDIGTWEPLSPQPVNGKFVPGTAAEAVAMLKSGDFKIRLHGKRLKGDFALVRMKGRRPGSKGNEWLLIKKKDDVVVPGYNIEDYDTSALSKRSMAQIAGDSGSAQWKSSRPAARGKLKAAWLADAIARADKKKAKAPPGKTSSKKKAPGEGELDKDSAPAALTGLAGAIRRPMPEKITPMLATSIEKPFDDKDWLYEIKWDGYRAIAFIEDGKVRLVSRNQNDLTAQYPELQALPKLVKAKTAILDGEVVALDDEGRASFSLMQQRTGIRSGGRRTAGRSDVPVFFYVFDLLYIDGFDLRRVPLEERKQVLAKSVVVRDPLRYSDHFNEGVSLFAAAKKNGLEGILAKRRNSVYEERRTQEWLKIKITQTLDCVVGGYTDPEGTRQHFGSLVLGLYDKKGRLIHVGQAGTGFDQKTLADIRQRLKKIETKANPFYGEVEALREVHWVKPKLVAEIKFSEWTHETAEGGQKLRAPVFMGLRDDKKPEECVFEQ